MIEQEQRDRMRWEVYSEFWPDRLSGPWKVTVGFRLLSDRWEPVGIEVGEKDHLTAGMVGEPSHILTAALLRGVPLGYLVERGRRFLIGSARIVAECYDKDGDVENAEWAREWGRKYRTKREGRPRKYGDEHYREVAAIYSAAWRNGVPPTQAVQMAFADGTRGPSHATAARWVGEARKRGFLTATRHGKAGGDLPPVGEEDK